MTRDTQIEYPPDLPFTKQLDVELRYMDHLDRRSKAM